MAPLLSAQHKPGMGRAASVFLQPPDPGERWRRYKRQPQAGFPARHTPGNGTHPHAHRSTLVSCPPRHHPSTPATIRSSPSFPILLQTPSSPSGTPTPHPGHPPVSSRPRHPRRPRYHPRAPNDEPEKRSQDHAATASEGCAERHHQYHLADQPAPSPPCGETRPQRALVAHVRALPDARRKTLDSPLAVIRQTTIASNHPWRICRLQRRPAGHHQPTRRPSRLTPPSRSLSR